MGELLGNQVEQKMFEASGWEIHAKGFFSTSNPKASIQSVNVARQMAFDQATQTSGVVVMLPNGQQKALIKGSFEKMAGLAGGRISEGLQKKVAELSKNQYYVIT